MITTVEYPGYFSRIKWILIFLLGLGLHNLHAQIVTVKDVETDRPLELAILVNQNQSLFVSTNAQGQADIMGFDPDDTIRIQLIGYRTTSISFQSLEQLDYEIHLDPSNISLDQVVVSANRWNQSRQDIPSRVTSISPSEVDFENPQTTADVLGACGEVFVQKSQLGGGSPMIRGFSTNRLLYSVDGVRMNTAIFRSGNLQNVISLDPNVLEKTEILFGPGSVIYGSDAIGAVMSFQTLKPQLSLSHKPMIKGKSLLRYATANQEKTIHGSLNAGWAKWALVTSITATDYHDLRMGVNGPESYLRPFYVERKNGQDVIIPNKDPRNQIPTGYSQLNLMQKVLFKPAEAWELQYGFHYSTTSDIPRYDRHIRLRNGEPRSAEWYYGPQVWMMNQISAHHKNENPLYDQLTLRLAYQLFKESRHDRDLGESTLLERFEKVNAFSANLDLTKKWNTKSMAFYGFEAVFDDVVSRGEDTSVETGESVTGSSRYPVSTWSSYALYASFHYDLTQNLTLQSGLRYNYFALSADFTNNILFYPLYFTRTNMENDAVTGSLGLVFRPNQEWSLYGNLSTGFRAPNIDDMGKIFDSEPGSVVVPNPDLEAEYAFNYELGISRIIGEFIRMDVSGYYTLLNNAMVRRNSTLNGKDSIVYDGDISQVQAIQNAAQASVYGIQAGVEINLPYGLELTSKYNWQRGEEELNDGSVSPSRHAAPAFGTTRLIYRSGKFQLEGYVMYSAEVSADEMPIEEQGKEYIYAADENGDPYSPGWCTLNFKSSYQLSDQIDIQAGFENITNQRYRPYSSGIVAPGINFILSVRATI